MKKLIPLAVLMAACTPSMDKTEEGSKVEGEICEATDGYLRSVVNMPHVQEVVKFTNDKRQQRYKQIAENKKISPEQAGQNHYKEVVKNCPETICKLPFDS